MKKRMTPGRLALWSLLPIGLVLIEFVVLVGLGVAGVEVDTTHWAYEAVSTTLLVVGLLGLLGAAFAKTVQIGVRSSREP
jgi:predicted anti-sigma-YlaC factor YlaD